MSAILPNRQPPEYCHFTHAEKGMTRFPPNIEQIAVEVESGGVRHLVVRRNDLELSFRLEQSDVEHLVSMLQK